MTPLPFRRALVLAPHTDDAELGCGGTVARLLESGATVDVAAFSTAEESLPPGAPPDTLRHEFYAASAALGLDERRLHVFAYPVRRLNEHRQDVLEALIRLRRDVDPDLVLLPSGQDLHQDHQVVFHEGMRAFKERTLLGYELPWNHVTFSAQAFVGLEERHLASKWRALQAYRTQLDLGRPYFTEAFIRGLACVRGTQVKAPLAEAFEVLRVRF